MVFTEKTSISVLPKVYLIGPPRAHFLHKIKEPLFPKSGSGQKDHD